jgi:hypothetical protein
MKSYETVFLKQALTYRSAGKQNFKNGMTGEQNNEQRIFRKDLFFA